MKRRTKRERGIVGGGRWEKARGRVGGREGEEIDL